VKIRDTAGTRSMTSLSLSNSSTNRIFQGKDYAFVVQLWSYIMKCKKENASIN
jgi:hypothetical protein